MILETQRLYLREMNQNDYRSLCAILQDEEAMYAYEGAFCDEEVQEWLDRQIARYERWGFGLWAVIQKETDEMIGQCGLTMQPCWRSAIFSAAGTGIKGMPSRPPMRVKNMRLKNWKQTRSVPSSETRTRPRRKWPFEMA